MKKPEWKKTNVFGQMNVSINKSALKQVIQSIEQFVDLDKLYELSESCFKKETIKTTPAFAKIAQVEGEKQTENTLLFMEKEVFPFWKQCFYSVDPVFEALESFLEKQEILTYVFGLYLAVHSSRMSDKEISKKDFIKYVFAEMFSLAAQRMQQNKT